MRSDTSLMEEASATTAPPVVVEVRDFSLDYTDPHLLRALRSVNLTVREGEIMALVGETGSGKSSLAHSVLNLLPRSSKAEGSITINVQGKQARPLQMSVDEARAFRRENIAFIPQLTKRALVPVLTVAEHFRQYLSASGDAKARDVVEVAAPRLREVGLTDPRRVLASYPHQLSGGMAQRVCIALAMCGSSSLVVADEPTSGLDALVKLRVADLLGTTVAEKRRTMLLVTHDLLLVRRIATKVAVLYGGCLVEVGPVESVFEAPAHPYTEMLLGATPQPGKPLKVIPGAAPRLSGPLTRCVFADRCPVKDDRCVAEAPALRSLTDEHEVASWCNR